jgi:putative glutamine amidotransferase
MAESKRLLIGLLGHKHAGKFNDGYGQNEAYIEFFRKYGDIIIIDAQCETVIPVDLLILPGGRDVNPSRYGQKPGMTTQPPDLEYEWFFGNMFDSYLKRAEEFKTAIYGICAGFQNLVVEFGGSLRQSYSQKQSYKFRGELVDKLELNKEFLSDSPIMSKAFREYKHKANYNETNSIHHQAVLKSDLTDDFIVIATNKEFDNVEFIIHKELPIAAEQSHPEERLNPLLTHSLLDNLIFKIRNNE